MMNDRKNILYLLGISMVLLVLVTWSLQLLGNYSKPEYIFPDAITYRYAAELLYDHNFSASSIRPFGYPLIIGLPRLFGHVSDLFILRFAIVLNVIFWLLTVAVLYRIIRRLAPSKVAFVGTLIFITCFSHVTGIFESLSETFFLLIVLQAFLSLLKYVQEQRSTDALLFIGLLCFSVTVRPISLYFAVLAAVCGIAFFLFRRQWRQAAIALVLLLSTVGLQSAIMQRSFGTRSLTYIQNYTLYTYLMCTAEYLQQGKPGIFGEFYGKRMAATDSLLAIHPHDTPPYWKNADAYYKENVKHNFATNKANVIKSMLLNMLNNCRAGSSTVSAAHNLTGSSLFSPTQKLLDKITYWQNVLLSLALIGCEAWMAFALLFRRRKHGAALFFIVPLCLFAAYCFAAAGISFWQADRFTFILYPFTLIALAYIASGQRTSRTSLH